MVFATNRNFCCSALMAPRNIFFWIMTDEQRADTLAAENPDVRVIPALDALASESIEFAHERSGT